MLRTKKFKSVPLAAATAIVALLAAGCSGAPASGDVAANAKVSTPAIAKAGTLGVCMGLSGGEPPNYGFDAQKNPVGVEVDFAKDVAKRLGLQLNLVDIKFASIVPALQASKCDVIMSSLYIKPAREKIVDFVPYMNSGSSVAVAAGNPAGITGMDDSLCGKKVVSTVGTTAALLSEDQQKKCAADGKPELQIINNDNTPSALQMVLTKQVDAYAGTSTAVLYYQQQSSANFEIAGKPFGTIKIGAAVTKGNATLQQNIKEAFASMKSDGTYAATLKKYNVSAMALQD
ncbi:ABC transporter substrate-binding protein [Specibacter cremeus]|uniref:ABC transporter substrate-binding protein n=1 Tax=Specibacter cremeus TaxID=1629051 RepID=UPI000F767CE1|nr:ABC transporter substrate-binding protein [Specibacter cremeus]